MELNRDQWINIFILSFLLGISFCSVLIKENFVFYFLPLAFLFLIISIRTELIESKCYIHFILIVLIGLFLGVGRFMVDFSGNLRLSIVGEEKVEMLVKIASLPEVGEGDVRAMVKVLESSDDGVRNLGFLAQFVKGVEIDYGEEMVIKGVIQVRAKNDYEKLLIYQRHLNGIIKNVEIIERIAAGSDDPLVYLFKLRKILLNFWNANFSEPTASLVSGIMIGERNSLPPDLAEDFQITGLTHILAISGFNITIIINVVMFLLVNLERKSQFVFSLVLISLFVIITGASASVIRAAVMGIMMLFTKVVAKIVDPFKILLMSVFLITFYDPRLLNFDLSFQLSSMATLSMIWFTSLMDDIFEGNWFAVFSEAIFSTVAAQIITLPIIFYHFGSISIISPLSNMVIGPTIPFLMLMSALTLPFYWFPPFLILIRGVLEMIINIMASVIAVMADIPFAQIEYGEGALLSVLIYYLIIFSFFHKPRLVLN